MRFAKLKAECLILVFLDFKYESSFELFEAGILSMLLDLGFEFFSERGFLHGSGDLVLVLYLG